jgi:hypothetical protein
MNDKMVNGVVGGAVVEVDRRESESKNSNSNSNTFIQ